MYGHGGLNSFSYLLCLRICEEGLAPWSAIESWRPREPDSVLHCFILLTWEMNSSTFQVTASQNRVLGFFCSLHC